MRELLPIACSLDAIDQSSRRQEWERVIKDSLLERTPVEMGVRMKFDRSGTLPTIERLITLERECCAWIDWALSDDGTNVMLEATAQTEEGVKVLQSWF